jgi:hypothetical protein
MAGSWRRDHISEGPPATHWRHRAFEIRSHKPDVHRNARATDQTGKGAHARRVTFAKSPAVRERQAIQARSQRTLHCRRRPGLVDRLIAFLRATLSALQRQSHALRAEFERIRAGAGAERVQTLFGERVSLSLANMRTKKAAHSPDSIAAKSRGDALSGQVVLAPTEN